MTRPLSVQFLSFSCNFRHKSCQIIRFLSKLRGWRPRLKNSWFTTAFPRKTKENENTSEGSEGVLCANGINCVQCHNVTPTQWDFVVRMNISLNWIPVCIVPSNLIHWLFYGISWKNWQNRMLGPPGWRPACGKCWIHPCNAQAIRMHFMLNE